MIEQSNWTWRGTGQWHGVGEWVVVRDNGTGQYVEQWDRVIEKGQ